MRIRAKKLLSLFIALSTVILVLAPCFVGASATGSNIPVVYVEGQGQHLHAVKGDYSSKLIFPLSIPENYIADMAKKYLPVFAKAVVTQKWDEFCKAVYDIVVPLFDEIRLDKNGDASDGSGVGWTWDRETLTDTAVDGKYNVTDYLFQYDWRLDPLVIADELARYIEDVKAVTHCEKVGLSGRCLGAAIVSAYLCKYGSGSIDTTILYSASVDGVISCSKPFTGEMWIDSDSVDRYVDDISLTGDNYVDELLRAFINLANETYGLDFLAWSVNNVYPDIYLKINPPVLRGCYGSFPSYWSMVNTDEFEEAKDVVFYGTDKNEYSGLISKIDYYHNFVQAPLHAKLKAMADGGMKIGILAKYGHQIVPVFEECDDVGDDIITLKNASLGASASKIDGTLSDEYLAAANAKYISLDKQVDASTCLFPDSTWIIKNLRHTAFPDCVNTLIEEIVNSEGRMTVDDNARYPQFLVYNEADSQIYPMTQENYNTTERWNDSFGKSIIIIFKSLFNILRSLIVKQFKPIFG